MTQIQIDWSRAQESKRHNLAAELQAANELAETNRHNVAYEHETKRHNASTENETHRHNVAYEHETNRHNVVSERQENARIAETNRHNVVTETETNRHNIVSESVEKSKVAETKRHNKASEAVEKSKVKEATRHNKASEAVEKSKVKETTRHNKTSESQKDVELKQQGQKIASEVSYNEARTAAQNFANSIDKSDPTLFKANRFSAVFKKDAWPAWIYYGLDQASDTQQTTLDAAANGTTTVEKAINVIDALNYKKTGKHLSQADKDAWTRIFTLGASKSSTKAKTKSSSSKKQSILERNTKFKF